MKIFKKKACKGRIEGVSTIKGTINCSRIHKDDTWHGACVAGTQWYWKKDKYGELTIRWGAEPVSIDATVWNGGFEINAIAPWFEMDQ